MDHRRDESSLPPGEAPDAASASPDVRVADRHPRRDFLKKTAARLIYVAPIVETFVAAPLMAASGFGSIGSVGGAPPPPETPPLDKSAEVQPIVPSPK
ncbi:MAG: hypothetical protein L6Q92_06295 [Phycisphaerae bacterium]|nr:hypothetical protein [Phycisphaerae bacterium]